MSINLQMTTMLFRGGPSSQGTNLGYATVSPTFDYEGDLIVVYPLNTTSTTICPNGTMSVITFACVKDSLVCGYYNYVFFHVDLIFGPQGEPAFVGADSCRYDFVWQSSAACPQKSVSGSPCILTDLTTGFTYNLTSLRNPSKDYSFVFNILSLRIFRCILCLSSSPWVNSNFFNQDFNHCLWALCTHTR